MKTFMKCKLRLIAISIILLTTVGCDQVTKEAARLYLSPASPLTYLNGFLNLILANNTGGFLGWGSQLPESIRFILFSTLVGIALFACLLYVFFSNRLSSQMLIAYSLIIAGGAGNLIDRLIFSGRVTDFILLSLGPLSTGIFNVADVVFMVGIGLFIFQHFHSPNQSSGG
jgi:signal peptidase II